ncbi:MAG TPA: SDR family oxidoreductase [Methylomirabilota bacterium]|jgi:NAD(P)-dependent dehydrogenase (short-subunit alcohol dehydrogenase family)|nr:SDR family oxidoreductase [Methylomirabilota bacterium]
MSLEAFTLQGKTALVIGASTAIGHAIALALAEAGADIAVASTLSHQREAEAISLCCSELQARGCKAIAQTLDASNENEVNALVQRTVTELGQLDILVNAPDLPFAKPVTDISLGEWRRVLEINLTGPYLACRAVAGPMLARGTGRIINVVSPLGERGMINGSAYCAAQAGVLNLTRALALEWARQGVTVNAIGAGWTEGMGLIADKALQQQLMRYIPQRRLAQPDDIAAAAVYLASDSTGFVTGQVIWIDGAVRSRL